MDLKDFVQDALLQITQAVSGAQLKSGSAIINPTPRSEIVENIAGKHERVLNVDALARMNLLATEYAGGIAEMIEFDIATTVGTTDESVTEKDKKVGGGLRIQVVSAGVDAHSKSTDAIKKSDSRVSRIRFRIPVQFPRP
jgi:hypothetical protein